MGYVGNQQAEGFVQRPTKQDLTGATGTSLTLTHAVSKEEDIDLYINNVKQEPTTAYTVADTAVTLTGSVVATDDIYVVYNSLALQTVVPPDGSVTSAKLAGLTSSDMPSGSVLQVVQGIKTDSANTTSTSFTNTGLSASITPSSASSKILIMVNTVIGQSNFQKRVHLKLTGGNTASYIGDAGTGVESAVSVVTRVTDAYGMMPISMQYLDSPATTSAITYQVQWRVESDTAYMNRPATLDANGANTASTIILQEIAG